MPEHFYVYPSYLAAASRAEGRRVTKDMRVTKADQVTLEEMASAARRLGFEATVEEKHYPRNWSQYQGRLKVTKKAQVKKTSFLKDLAVELAKARPSP